MRFLNAVFSVFRFGQQAGRPGDPGLYDGVREFLVYEGESSFLVFEASSELLAYLGEAG